VASYRLLLKASAAREIEKTGSRADRRRIIERTKALVEEPRPMGAEKLAGYEDRYRVRQGDYRIVYLIDDKTTTVTVFKLGHRKDVYR
jgi:mRNA interferase RelE/StbE